MTSDDKSALNAFFTSLESQGTLAAITANANSVLYIPALDRGAFRALDGDATLNLLSASNPMTIAAGAPRVVPGGGVYANGVDSSIAAPAPSTQAQNSVCIAFYSRWDEQQGGASVGTATGASVLISSRNTSNKRPFALNQASVITPTETVANGFGFTAANRTGAAVVNAWRGAIKVDGTDFTTASTAPSTVPINLGRNNGNFRVNTYPFYLMSPGLTDAQMVVLANATEALMATLGLNKAAGTSNLVAGAIQALTLVDRKKLPDGSAPFQAGAGFANTGLSRSPARTFMWAGNGGTPGTIPVRINRISNVASPTDATVTLLSEKLISELFPAIGTAQSMQGVFADHALGTATDTNHDVYAQATGADGSKFILRMGWNGTDLTAISAGTTPGGTSGNVNSAVRDKRGTWWLLDGSVVRESIMDASGNFTFVSGGVSFQVPGGNTDQLGYDFLTDTLMVSGGANSVDGYVVFYQLLGSIGRPYITKQVSLAQALGIEGVELMSRAVAANGRSFTASVMTMNDQGPGSHPEASFPYNSLFIHGPLTPTPELTVPTW